jgi:hypothetical protein
MRPRKKPRLLKPLEPLTDEQLNRLIKGLRLNSKQARNLCIALLHAREDIETRNRILKERPDDREIRRSYKDFDEALAQVQRAVTAHGSKGSYCLPHDTLGALGNLLSDDALRAAAPAGTVNRRGAISDSERQALALKYGPELLAHAMDQLRGPLQRWLKADRANKGGRPGGSTREILIQALAEHAESITGKRASASPTSPFVRLSEAVLLTCRLSTAGLDKMIQRALQKRSRAATPTSRPRNLRDEP